MPDLALSVTTLLWALAAISSAVIAVPQSVLLVRTAGHRDRLWFFRLKSVLLFGALALAMLRNLTVWADYTFFGQRFLGAIDQRWTFDLAVSALIALACALSAALYVRVQHEVRP